MPDDQSHNDIAKVEALGKQATSNMLDTLIRVFSLQMALVNKGVLSQEEIDRQFDALNNLDSVQRVRSQYGSKEPTLGNILDSLLRNYEGRLQ